MTLRTRIRERRGLGSRRSRARGLHLAPAEQSCSTTIGRATSHHLILENAASHPIRVSLDLHVSGAGWFASLNPASALRERTEPWIHPGERLDLQVTIHPPHRRMKGPHRVCLEVWDADDPTHRAHACIHLHLDESSEPSPHADSSSTP